jgi:hypothetical protein
MLKHGARALPCRPVRATGNRPEGYRWRTSTTSPKINRGLTRIERMGSRPIGRAAKKQNVMERKTVVALV